MWEGDEKTKIKNNLSGAVTPISGLFQEEGVVRFLLTSQGSDVCSLRYGQTEAFSTAPQYPRDAEINWIPPQRQRGPHAPRAHGPTPHPRSPREPRGALRTGGGGVGRGRRVRWCPGGAERFSGSRCNFCLITPTPWGSRRPHGNRRDVSPLKYRGLCGLSAERARRSGDGAGGQSPVRSAEVTATCGRPPPSRTHPAGAEPSRAEPRGPHGRLLPRVTRYSRPSPFPGSGKVPQGPSAALRPQPPGRPGSALPRRQLSTGRARGRRSGRLRSRPGPIPICCPLSRPDGASRAGEGPRALRSCPQHACAGPAPGGGVR